MSRRPGLTQPAQSASLEITERGKTTPDLSLLRRLKRQWTAYLFLLPTFVFLAYFLYLPAWTALSGAFTSWDGFNPPEFIGLDNFKKALDDEVLKTAAINNVIWAVFKIVLALLPPFLVAELIFHVKSRWQYLYRTLFTFQLVVPTVVTILLWTYFYRGDGSLNQLLQIVGLGQIQQLWIADPKIALYSLVLYGFPWIAAFNLLIFYAGLQSISTEIFEAAAVEGATGFKRIWFLDLPLLLPQFKLLLVLAVIGSVQGILEPLLMTKGGPGNATTMPILVVYNSAIQYGEFGYSMAISFILFIVILGLTGLNIRFFRVNE